MASGGRTAKRVVALGAALAATAAAALYALAASSSPNTYFYANRDQWGLVGAPASINVGPAWCRSTGAGVVIADVDTGADFNHPDLSGRLIAGARFTNGDGTPSSGGVQDDVGHGTMTTGIMVADTTRPSGMAGIAYSAKALIIKVLVPATDATGAPSASGSVSDVAAGIDYAVAHGANVINLSIGSDVPLAGATFQPILDSITNAYNHNVAVAVAAGNSSLPVSDYQSISNYALVVGAVGPGGVQAYYSTSGVGVNAWAPGGDDTKAGYGYHMYNQILSTFLGDSTNNDRFAVGEGTSFAAPHAAGLLALLYAIDHNAQADRQKVLSTLGSGLYPEIDATRALGTAGMTCSDGPAGPPASAPPGGPPPVLPTPTSHGGGVGSPTPGHGGGSHPAGSPGGAGTGPAAGATTPGSPGPTPAPSAAPGSSPDQVALVSPSDGPLPPAGVAVPPHPNPPGPPLLPLGLGGGALALAGGGLIWHARARATAR